MKRILVLALTVLLTGCPYIDKDYEFEYDTIVSDIPVNLHGINSRFDDYNSDLPYPYAGRGIYFSSNRYSGGNQYNIIHKGLSLSYHVKDDVLDVHYNNNEYTSYESRLLELINSEGDELGPFDFWGPQEYSYFFYASNQDGDFDIKYAFYDKSDFGTYQAREVLQGPVNLDLVNSEYDDLYPNINDEQTQLLFCSNRDNDQFDIYSIPLPSEELLHDFFVSVEAGETSLVSALSSNGNDKCPFVSDDLLVFASDREGGYGGFDLYYSHLKEGAWSTPVNFGPSINSEDDEYRPITFFFYELNPVMIFSSDRPGGAGGFDLYMVKLDNEL
jgi:hypothetical protein